jgi:hypothetical protein
MCKQVCSTLGTERIKQLYFVLVGLYHDSLTQYHFCVYFRSYFPDTLT